MPNLVYRSRVLVQRDPALSPIGTPCDHRYHRTLKSAQDCLGTRVREVLARPVIQVTGVVEQSYSRHDWFTVRTPKEN
jgi:hypothetical protein